VPLVHVTLQVELPSHTTSQPFSHTIVQFAL
jgi:hypothetical protein